MTEQAGLPGAKKSLALLEKLKRRVNEAAATPEDVPVLPAASSTRSGRVPGVRSSRGLAPAAPELPLPKPPPPLALNLKPTVAPPPAQPAQPAPRAPLAEPAPAAPPQLSVRAKFASVNWERRAPEPTPAPRQEVAKVEPEAQAASVMSVRAKFASVNWDRRPVAPTQAASTPPVEQSSPIASVESFFSDIQW